MNGSYGGDTKDEVRLWGLVILGVAIALTGIAFWAHACDVGDQATLGNLEQKVRTRNFEESEAYRAGLRRDFDELLLSYAHAKSAEEKATIRSVIRHRAEGCPPDQVPQDIRDLLDHPEAP